MSSIACNFQDKMIRKNLSKKSKLTDILTINDGMDENTMIQREYIYPWFLGQVKLKVRYHSHVILMQMTKGLKKMILGSNKC